MKQKKILLVMPDFQCIYKVVIQELMRQDYDVTYVSLPFLRQAIHRSNPIINYAEGILNRFIDIGKYNEIKETVDNNFFDVIFAIGGFFFSQRILTRAKKRNPLLKTIVFYWDSFSIWDYSKTIEYFDRRFSFDIEDCKKYFSKKLQYHPNFYLTSKKPNPFPQYDICNISTTAMSLHMSRLCVVYALKEDADKMGLTSFIRLYMPEDKKRTLLQWITHIKYLLKPRHRDFFCKRNYGIKKGIVTSHKLTLEECYIIESNSRCIIDVPVDGQHGHTIRSLNAIASGQKLITTDAYLRNEPFFHPNNICVIDAKYPHINEEFLSSAMVDVDISHLKLDNWLIYILDGKE